MRNVLRETVDVEVGVHSFMLTDRPLYVAHGVRGKIDFWYEFNPDATPVQWRVYAFATGRPIPDGATWIGTAVDNDRGLVWHLYRLVD